jgi:hypothetical protein
MHFPRTCAPRRHATLLLVPSCQGGKDAASARYIYTKLAALTRHLFNEQDDQLLDYLNEDGQKIEPAWWGTGSGACNPYNVCPPHAWPQPATLEMDLSCAVCNRPCMAFSSDQLWKPQHRRPVTVNPL